MCDANADNAYTRKEEGATAKERREFVSAVGGETRLFSMYSARPQKPFEYDK